MTIPCVAVWGLGQHALKRIIPALSSMEELSLVGVCSRNQEVISECSLKWKCIGWTDPTEMLENDTVDIIYLAAPIGVHKNLAIKALKAGKHVWCEKPLTCNYEDSELLVKLAKQGNQMLAECFMYLHHPQFTRVFGFANNDEAGPVHFVSCRFGIPFLEKPGFRHDPDLCGGAFWDVASYTISAVLELFPEQEPEVVFAEVCKKENFPVDIEGRALLSFSNGAKAYLDWGIGLGYRNEIDIWAENGSLFTDKVFSKPESYRPVYRLRDKNGNETLEYGEQSEQFIEMLRSFCCMLDNTKLTADERVRILQRAKVMDEIVRFSNRNIE